MTNYLNQIESDLYKLNSITNGSGEVVEMVSELKEKYRKAKAFDEVLRIYDESKSNTLLADDVIEIVQKYESGEME